MAPKRKYDFTIKYPDFFPKRRIGPEQGYSRLEAIEYVANALVEKKFIIKTVKFDHKDVLPEHKSKLMKMAEIWNELKGLEQNIKPRAARKAKLAMKQNPPSQPN